MYPNLKAEMARQGVTMTELANRLKWYPAKLSAKMHGKQPFKLDECAAIKVALHVSIPLETLFENVEQ